MYDLFDESVDENPIKVFTRLNIGKIGLTNGELIKGTYRRTLRHNFSNDASIEIAAAEIASQWDDINYITKKTFGSSFMIKVIRGLRV